MTERNLIKLVDKTSKIYFCFIENKIEVERIRNAYRSAVKYNKADLYHFARFELRQKNNIVAEKMAKESCEELKNNKGCMLWGSLLVEKDEKQKGK